MRPCHPTACLVVLGLVGLLRASTGQEKTWRIRGGTTTLTLVPDESVIVRARAGKDELVAEPRVASATSLEFPVDPSSTLLLVTRGDGIVHVAGRILHTGMTTVDTSGPDFVLQDLIVEPFARTSFDRFLVFGGETAGRLGLLLEECEVTYDVISRTLTIESHRVRAFGRRGSLAPDRKSQDLRIGSVMIHAELEPIREEELQRGGRLTTDPATLAAMGTGPDIITSEIGGEAGVMSYGSETTCSVSGGVCDTGADCNACDVSGGPCLVDDDCGICAVTSTPCVSDSDCTTCSGSGALCVRDNDCKTCGAGGSPCLTVFDCETGSCVLLESCESVQTCGPSGETCVLSGETCDVRIASFSFGTISCNIGDASADWFASSNKHPVISQTMYRLKDDRFEQIGMAWLKHGFFATDDTLCSGPGGCDRDASPTRLGVGCSDTYGAGLNGEQSNLGPRSDVNAHTGAFVFPFSAPDFDRGIGRRLQVHEADLHPATNAEALYFVEGQYISADEALAGNSDNNMSYRRVQVTGPDENGVFRATTSSQTPTQRERAAIQAWRDEDVSVKETLVPVPGEGLFILAARASQLPSGQWQYEYALQNVNSDRSAGSFSVPMQLLPPDIAVVESIGFHDVDYHGGEPFDGTDWPGTFVDDAVTWSTASFAADPNANALRFGTLYNFRFLANVEPIDDGEVTIGLFKPGAPGFVTATTIVPAQTIDCNGNQIPDDCDLDCGAPGGPCDVLGCGESLDCTGNGVLDECEADCNDNGIADSCDIATCPPGDLSCADCNDNTVPDGCSQEIDCDGDGIPSDCDDDEDTDDDGLDDCVDLCPTTNPQGLCVCPPEGECCRTEFGIELCFGPISPEICLEQGGVPDCRATELCRDGCLLGDFQDDGNLDLGDVAWLQVCFGRSSTDLAGLTPSTAECLRVFDLVDDGVVDLSDFVVFQEFLMAP